MQMCSTSYPLEPRRDLLSNRNGATATVVGLVFFSLIGFLGLGSEADMWY